RLLWHNVFPLNVDLNLSQISEVLYETCQQPSAMLDSSKDIDLDLYQELNDKQPLSTIDENLNQSNYEQLNLEENPKQSYTPIQVFTLKAIIFIL
ncbi:2065_t:CDS:2, partial [Gigaspora rosea]